jgi:excisionase family DNA binding protein
MNPLVETLLAELDDVALDELARRLAPRLLELLPTGAATDRLLSATDAASYAGVHPETLRRAIRAGELAVAGRVGRSPRLAHADVDAWLNGGRIRATRPRAARRSRRSDRGVRSMADAFAAQSTGDAS